MALEITCATCRGEDGMHSFGCPRSRQQREQALFGSGPNSIDPADRQDARCDVCHGSGERVVNTEDIPDPMYDRAIDCTECGGKGFVDPFSEDAL